jgi:hypothetical protein
VDAVRRRRCAAGHHGWRWTSGCAAVVTLLIATQAVAGPPPLCPKVSGDLHQDGARFPYQLPVGGPGMVVQIRSANPQRGFDRGLSDFYAVITARCEDGRWTILETHTQSFAD